jgi:hypothetical protein
MKKEWNTRTHTHTHTHTQTQTQNQQIGRNYYIHFNINTEY